MSYTHPPDSILITLAIIYVSAALMATLALVTRQSLLVAYIILGMVIGPFGLKLLPNDGQPFEQVGHMGIIFLLFLVGLELQPQKLWHMFRDASFTTIITSLIFALLAFTLTEPFGFSLSDRMLIAICMMFSSTIIGLKLLPERTLQSSRTGEIVTSILLLQDVIAIIILTALELFNVGSYSWLHTGSIIIALPILAILAYVIEHFIFQSLLKRFEKSQEYIFLLSVAWCAGMAALAEFLGLSGGIGAFIAGVAIASGSPISEHISRSLRPLRDFFLVLFFFFIGAHFNYHALPQIILPALVLALTMLIIKPLAYRMTINTIIHNKKTAWEIGVRLGQASEFALLIVYLAQQLNLISSRASYVVQATTILTFIVSSSVVVLRYNTPTKHLPTSSTS